MALADVGPPEMNSGDTAWMLVSSGVVLLMTVPGLLLFYGGMGHRKNVVSTLMQSFTICGLITVVWVAVGYSLAFGVGGFFFIGYDQILMTGITTHKQGGLVPEAVFVIFQMTFAIIAPAIITGAFTGRIRFKSLLLFSVLWVILVYAPVTHWLWGGGFLQRLGVLDFAGGTVVHINAGVAGLVAALVIGRGIDHQKRERPPHNLPLCVIGASLLWIGWFGFNGGSALAADGRAALAILCTQVAAATGMLSWMGVEWLRRGKPSLLGNISGAVSGLVAITPASGYVEPIGAAVIGIAGGASCYWACRSLKPLGNYDDSLDAFGIHGLGGIVGALLTGVFAREAIGGTAGLLEGNPYQLVLQGFGVLVVVTYCAGVTFVLLKLIQKVMGLRVDRDIEIDGLDLHEHGERAEDR